MWFSIVDTEWQQFSRGSDKDIFQSYLQMPGIEPETSCMKSRCPTTKTMGQYGQLRAICGAAVPSFLCASRLLLPRNLRLS